jgi:hypothetical protein
MREIVHMQAGQCGNQIGAKVKKQELSLAFVRFFSSFGKLFRMNMVSTQQVLIMEILIFNLSASMFIIMKHRVNRFYLNSQ